VVVALKDRRGEPGLLTFYRRSVERTREPMLAINPRIMSRLRGQRPVAQRESHVHR
jgi:hypothetical protein